jgi:hypothetical protein
MDSPPQPQATTPSLISGIAHLALWCLLEGKSNTFKVEIPDNADIGDLKTTIKLEKPIELERVDADKLVLWKVGKLYYDTSTI